MEELGHATTPAERAWLLGHCFPKPQASSFSAEGTWQESGQGPELVAGGDVVNVSCSSNPVLDFLSPIHSSWLQPPGTHKGYSWMNCCVIGVVKSNFIYTTTDRLTHRDASVLRSAWAKNYWLVSKLITVASAMR